MTQTHEYRVIPAPRRGEKAKGARTTAERFGVALAHAMNEMAREGWEYIRSETLPCDERVGLTGTATHFHHMLVFRRPRAAGPAAAAAAPPPAIAASSPSPPPAAAVTPDTGATVSVPLRPEVQEGKAPPLGPATAGAPRTTLRR